MTSTASSPSRSRRAPRVARAFAALLLLLAMASPLHAVQFGAEEAVSWRSIVNDTRTFIADLTGRGDAAGARQAAVLGALLAGVSCGVLGCFVTLRRMAMFGDMLGHAVLPGVAIGFVIAGRKSTVALVLGALGAGLAAAWLTRWIRSRSLIKEDAALGISLGLFYALGIWMLSWILRRPELSSEASGLATYLFGNPAVISPQDLSFLGASTLIVVGAVVLLFKELLTCSFDPCFAVSIGIRRGTIDAFLIVLLTFVIVVSIHILGVVLVAAMLTIPPATAYLLTDRLPRMIAYAALLGAGAGLCGVYASVVLRIGVGPSIVCIAFAWLCAAFLLAPRHGLLGRWLRQRRLALRTVRENLLASIYRLQERGELTDAAEVPVATLAHARREPLAATAALARRLAGSGWGCLRGDAIELTAAGRERAREVVRNHRLWELFLEREASLAPDHVHAGAEEVEHFLSEEQIAALEAYLEYPTEDPHGRSIPGASTARGSAPPHAEDAS